MAAVSSNAPDPLAPAPADPSGAWTWIDTPAALATLVERLRTQPCFALDTESNSMHAHRERMCLVQLSLPELDALVDPLAVDLRPLGPVLADPSIEKVMHGADYDILCFKREYGFSFAGLYDTMLAARVLGWPSHGLGAILHERYGFVVDKRMQRFDWGQRPLPQAALDYARRDTRFLLALQREQRAALAASDRAEELAHACLRQTRVEPRPYRADALGMWRLKGARGLPPAGRAVLWALHELREAVAIELDRPVFRVMSDELLLALARHPPHDEAALAALRGLHPALRGAGGARLLEAIEAGLAAEPPRPPPVDRGPSRVVVTRLDALRAVRKAIADERGLPPELVLGKEALMAVAVSDPRTLEELRASGALDEWELPRYGAALLRALRGAG
jgi:ribonuclease D